MIFDLSKTQSIANVFVSELRDENIQKDAMRFRKNLERLGEFFAYEISKTLKYTDTETQTPLGIAQTKKLEEEPVLATILRAGLPMHKGLLNVFDKADSAFVTAFRKTHKSGDFEIQIEYISSPDLTDKIVIMADPMLATGLSMVLCCKELLNRFQLKELHVVVAIASTEGIRHLRANLPQVKLWVGAIDEEMTSKSYIVPGLGDAGDLAYGKETLMELFEHYKLSDLGLKSAEDFIRTYTEINHRLWAEYHLGKIDKETLRNQRFTKAFIQSGIHPDHIPPKFEDDYVRLGPTKKNLFEGSEKVLSYLQKKYSLHIISNGFKESTLTKMEVSGLNPYFTNVIISEVVGVNKPDKAVFEYALEKAGAIKEESIMIGDSIEADIRGAQDFGMKAIFFNPFNKEKPEDVQWQITHLEELLLHF
eukprot:gene4719-5506_t